MIYAKVDFFDIGKWNPETDKSQYVQIFIAYPALAFFIVYVVIMQILVYGSEANYVDFTLVNILKEHIQKLARLKFFVANGLVYTTPSGRVHILTHEDNAEEWLE